ncbi:DC-STAMP domain-containing protein 2 [Clupea harengus]|uniref:DC-STAMP domain-containing protein 2 n=1 Tax=Clupea harengus TaxID=7950 RepID=A0A6P3VQE2_CLUHA|nr:DC-STAMP domain-containing protein 2 [Clupea harengus]
MALKPRIKAYSPRYRVSHESPFKKVKRSIRSFLVGLLIASVYGMMALFLQNHGLLYSIISTVVIAALAAFGMGLSKGIRANVMLMLPTLCSKNGKNILLFLAFSMVVQGPMSNTMENFDRAADSVVCGAEMAMNQTQELMERAATPLLPVLKKVKEVARNAYSLAGRVQNFIMSLTESVQHIARSLRNVLHFLAGIGDVCNDKLGTPYKRCNQLFDEARDDCREQLSVFAFLCYIVDGFKPLCHLAKAGQFFCIIPSYIADHIKTKLADMTVEAFKKLRKQFEFNISASMHYDVQLNSSQSMQEVSQKIMEEITEELYLFQKLSGLLSYLGLFLLAYIYIQAVMYKNSYLKRDDFDNSYITERFVQLDQRRLCEGRPTLLPLSQREALAYIQPLSLHLTGRERRAAITSTISVLRHIAVGCAIMALDLIVFWVFDTIQHLAKGEIVAKAPVMVTVEVNGSGYTSDIFKDIVASFDILQRGNITILSKKCLMEPREPDYTGYVVIGALYGLALFIVVAGSYVKRLRRLICANYHPKRERERIHALHQRILTQRLTVQKNLLRFVARSKEDGQSSGFLKALALVLPGGSRVARFLGAFDQSCMACGKVLEGEDDPNTHTCSTPKCKGLYCLQCFKSMDNICAVCMRPLTFQEDSEEELDSSDDQQVSLWTSALTSPHINQRRDWRRLMKRRISVATRRRSVTGQHRSKEPEDTAENSDSSPVIFDSDSDTSEPDMSYQHPESSKWNTKSLLNIVSVKAMEPQQRDSDTLSPNAHSMNRSHSEEMHLDTVVVQSSTSQ